MYRYYKKIAICSICVGSVFLSGCTGSSSTATTVGQFTFNVPTSYESISSTRLDQYQIVNNIIRAWKGTDKSSLVLSESSLPSSISIKQFTEETQSRLAQNMIGYSDGKISSTSFTCNGQKINGYIHSFTQTDIKDKTKILQYYSQFYYSINNSVYILSLAHPQKNSIVSSIVGSFGCVAKK